MRLCRKSIKRVVSFDFNHTKSLAVHEPKLRVKICKTSQYLSSQNAVVVVTHCHLQIAENSLEWREDLERLIGTSCFASSAASRHLQKKRAVMPCHQTTNQIGISTETAPLRFQTTGPCLEGILRPNVLDGETHLEAERHKFTVQMKMTQRMRKFLDKLAVQQNWKVRWKDFSSQIYQV